ncbi:MAG: DNA polymerase I, partial [Planctomycetota bacterium]|nr:DNA polymerase I [Planctomycetota bacterium]
MTRLFLIDGTALAYRAHFAFSMGPQGGLTTQSGRPTSAIYGFVTTLLSLMDKEKPDSIVAAFDGPTAGLERTRIYPEYKATRDKMPDEMGEQLPVIEEIVSSGYGIPVIRGTDHEADDIIGTLAVRGRAVGMEVFIVTSDKDFMQIVDDHLKLWNLRGSTKSPDIIGPAKVEEKFGVRPDQMIDLLALMGDSSDNIPGVPRVGQKTAAALLSQWGNLDEILAHAEDVKQPSISKSLQENRELAELSRRLVTINTDVQLDIDIGDLPAPEPNREVLEAMFRECEFTRLLGTLPEERQPEVPTEYALIQSEKEADDLLTALAGSEGFAFAVEAMGDHPVTAVPIGISFCRETGKAQHITLLPGSPLLEDGSLVERIRALLEDPDIPKTAHNAKAAMHALHRIGIELQGLAFDTSIASYCVNPNASPHTLDRLALRFFAHKKTELKDLLGTGKKKKSFDQLDPSTISAYVNEAADLTWRNREHLEEEIEETGVDTLFKELEMPLVPVLKDMELEGIAIDIDHLTRLDADLSSRIQKIEERVHERAGEPFNLNSPQQLGEVLFEKLEVHLAAGISRPKRTAKTGQFKTDAAILEKLAKYHEVPELLLEYRRLAKLLGTYVESLPKIINPDTGRIHTTLNQAVAATGRLSSDNPNLQNIPIRTEEGRKVRASFVARETGWILLSADYSQIELRILAHVSEEPALVKAFNQGEDIHARTAALVHGLIPEMVTPELRDQAKIINYGLIYGMGASRLAAETGMRPPEAKKFIQAYFRALPSVKNLLDANLEQARTDRAAYTIFGRRRPLEDIDSSNTMQRIASENMAVNTPIQGAAADIIKRAMLAVQRELKGRELQAKMILQVHDELI